jgi:uncharacterized protein (DUF58 family)
MTHDAMRDQSGGFLFSPAGTVLLAFIAGVAAWFGHDLSVLLMVTVLTLVMVARGWNRLALVKLAHGRHLETTRAFPGDLVACDLFLDNRKFLPLVRVEVSEPVPADIMPPPADLPPGARWSDGQVCVATSLLWYQRATLGYRLTCRRRGYFPLGPATVSASDIFGLFRTSRQSADTQHLIVYPRIRTLSDLGLPAGSPLGDATSRNPAFQDTTRFRGLRDYTPDIPFRHIHWKASARSHDLQVKTFEPMRTLRVALFLDAASFPQGDDDDPFELAVSTVASLAWHFIHERCAVGLFTNAAFADDSASGFIGAASGTKHLQRILEALAKAGRGTAPFGGVLDSARSDLVMGTTLAIVTNELSPPATAHLAAHRRRGFPVTVFHVGEGPASALPFPCHRLSPENGSTGNSG